MKKNFDELQTRELTLKEFELGNIVGGCPGHTNDPPPPCGP